MFWGNIQIVIWLFGFQLFEMFRPSTCDVILIKEIFRTNVFGFLSNLSLECRVVTEPGFGFCVCSVSRNELSNWQFSARWNAELGYSDFLPDVATFVACIARLLLPGFPNTEQKRIDIFALCSQGSSCQPTACFHSALFRWWFHLFSTIKMGWWTPMTYFFRVETTNQSCYSPSYVFWKQRCGQDCSEEFIESDWPPEHVTLRLPGCNWILPECIVSCWDSTNEFSYGQTETDANTCWLSHGIASNGIL